jgi:DNA-directed RNA polymerase II subunit RPB2
MKTKFSNAVEIKSVSEKSFGNIRSLNLKIKLTDNSIKLTTHRFKPEIPLWVFFIALGIESDKEIIEKIVYDVNAPENQAYLRLLRGSINDFNTISDFKGDNRRQSVALEYLTRQISYINSPKEIRLTIDDKVKYVKNVLETDFLPHVGSDFEDKIYFLGYMTNKLLHCHLEEDSQNYDDRDNYANKRVDTPGYLLGSLFSQCFKFLIKDMKKSIVKELGNNKNWRYEGDITEVINKKNISKLIKPTIIESGLKYSLATGDWKVKSSKSKSKSGTAQVLNRLTYPSGLSHLRRVNSPSEKNGKLVEPRRLHNTHWGINCPSETPEGQSVGLVKNMSNDCYITGYSNPQIVIDRLKILGIERVIEVEPARLHRETKIFVNGYLYGITPEPVILVSKLRSLRRQALINIYTSIFWNIRANEIQIYTDAGRDCRPLLIVDPPNKLRIRARDIELLKNGKYKWNNLILPVINKNKSTKAYDDEDNQDNEDEIANRQNSDLFERRESVIEFIDSSETDNLVIAMNQKELMNNDRDGYLYYYTHCEIHPSMILGVLASCIPFACHNQSPRNTYQSAMGKQAMGIYATNFQERLDSIAYILHYPQKPIVSTRFGKYFSNDKIPSGMNAIVAIACYTGYNQEDSVMINRSAVQRGFFISTFYRTYKDDEKKIQSSGQEERFVNPSTFNISSDKKRVASYENLDENGFPKINAYLTPNDVVIGKVIPIKNTQPMVLGTQTSFRDISSTLRSNETGFVDKVYINRNAEGFRVCKVRMRSERIPTIGDKFSSRHGQKGVCGMIYDEEDMPYSESGMSPHIIVNPHAIPSRMTVGHLMECILGKATTRLGGLGDSTAFTNLTPEQIGNVLMENGYDSYGDEILYDGFTGRQIKTKIFFGPTYYQRLKHMVDDKVHSRSTGPVVMLTRQPSEGRSRSGGLRLGEMERDVLISHGMALFLKERLMDLADDYRVYVCDYCKMFAAFNLFDKTPWKKDFKEVHYCKNCDNHYSFTEIQIPFACKLLFQELYSMGMAPRFITN